MLKRFATSAAHCRPGPPGRRFRARGDVLLHRAGPEDEEVHGR